LLDAAATLRAVPLVLESVFFALERLELANVGAGHERLPARTPQHEDADAVVAVHLFTSLRQAVVHRPGHRVAALRPVEQDRHDRPVARDDDVVLRAGVLGRTWHSLGRHGAGLLASCSMCVVAGWYHEVRRPSAWRQANAPDGRRSGRTAT